MNTNIINEMNLFIDEILTNPDKYYQLIDNTNEDMFDIIEEMSLSIEDYLNEKNII